jgi:hypothetical protein
MGGLSSAGFGLGSLSLLSSAKTRSLSAENPTGDKGKGAMAEPPADNPRHLGKGWKCRPRIGIAAGQTVEIANLDGPGVLQSIWMTSKRGRDLILRFYWDGQEHPSVECPLHDFFGYHWCYAGSTTMPWSPFAPLNSLPVTVNPERGLNCFWEMPFRAHCRITVENTSPSADNFLFYQINYTLTEVPEKAAYFHAQFRRVNPLPKGEVYTILDNVKGQGHYVGVSMGWGINHNGWWGEGEIKFYLDGDGEYPTICGTGLEDYFGGAWDWEVNKEYQVYSTPFMGMYQVIKPDGLYSAQLRHALYRWHIVDPVRFEKDFRVTIQALGHAEGGRFQFGTHDICSTAFWYQTLPHQPFPVLPDREELLVL